MGKKRGATKNTDKPHGQFGWFLNSELERLDLSVAEFRLKLAGVELEKDHDTILTWLAGTNSPRMPELAHIARALGYKTWLDMLAELSKRLPKKFRK